MTPRMLKQTLEEWSREVHVPADLAERALRRRSRLRLTRFAGAVSCAALVAAVALLVPLVVAPRFAPPVDTGGAPVVVPVQPYRVHPYRASSPARDVLADTENSPPKKMIAAGRVAVSAYFTWRRRAVAGREVMDRTWYLLDPVTESYEKTEWGWAEVAPGLRWAAVLEKDLPARRIGIFDMEKRQVRAWVSVDHLVGGVSWSPDGTQLVATAYDDHPDLSRDSVHYGRRCPARVAATPEDPRQPRFQTVSTSRTGFYVVDVATATAGDFHAVDPCWTDNSNVRRDFAWSGDGTLIRERSLSRWHDAFLDLAGRPHDAPPGHVATESKAGVSPDGTLLAGRDGMPTKVTELSTGKVVGRQQVLQLLAWADDRRLVALGCAGTCDNEFRNGLVLVSVDGRQTVPLTADRKHSQKPEAWEPILTLR
ncbi:hypothetical protein [Microbispora sp. H10836]|uniref:hypothetical protein n=1 Tax=Microbispora sp. H10836 TaxID=2729106 RepID=UPI001474929E|nr:hypothetical protein [Microbispora sp. H10836]